VVVAPLLDGTAVGLAYASLFGDSVPALVTTLLVAALITADMTVAGDAAGTADKYRAAIPATCGDAIDVPFNVFVALFPVYHAEVIPEPGANRSRHAPKFEYDARASVFVVAPTVSADTLLLPGDTVQPSTFAFPAATTTVIPSA
jgi:hypothetical protein